MPEGLEDSIEDTERINDVEGRQVWPDGDRSLYRILQLLYPGLLFDRNVHVCVQSLSGFASFLLIMFIIPMALQVVWAVMSFIQKRPAGIFGVIASSIYSVSSMIWVFVVSIAAAASYSFGEKTMTAIPVFMLLLGIAGIPVSIIQIVKRKYL